MLSTGTDGTQGALNKCIYTIREQGNLEDYVIVWLHGPNIQGESLQAGIAQLRCIVNYVKVFEMIDDFIAFLNTISNERVFLIVNLALNDEVGCCTKDLPCLQATYTLAEELSSTQTCHDDKAPISGVYTSLISIIEEIDTVINRPKSSDCLPISESLCTASQETMRFVYAHCIRAVVLDPKEPDLLAKEKMVNFFRREYSENSAQLKLIDEFERDYDSSKAIWWLTRPCFISKMISRALRVPEPDILYKTRSFIQDVHQQLKSAEQNVTMTLYLADNTSPAFIDKMRRERGNLIILPCFVSASSDKQVAWSKVVESNSRTTRVLFEMEMNSVNHVSANVDTLSYGGTQSEVLISFGSVFRVTTIEEIDDDEYCIHLTQVARNEQDFEKLVERMKKKIQAPAPLIRLGKLMCHIGDRARLEQLLSMLHEDGSVDHSEELGTSLAAVYSIVGNFNRKDGDIEQALVNNQKSLDVLRRVLPAYHPGLSAAYNNIGSMLFQLERGDEAITYHQKALDIQLESPHSDPASISAYLHNLGMICMQQNKTTEALRNLSLALQIKQKMCALNDPELASAYDAVGDIHVMREEYSQAISNYESALRTQLSAPEHNPQALAMYTRGLGNAYHQLNSPERSLEFFEQALTYSQEFAPSEAALGSLYNNIASQLFRLKRSQDALPYYIQSLEIQKSILPDNDPEIADLYMNLAANYSSMGQYNEAIATTETAIEQLMKTMPPDAEPIQQKQAFIQGLRDKAWLTSICTS